MGKFIKIYRILYLRSKMTAIFKRLLKCLIWVIGIFVVLIGSFIGYISLNDYDPPGFVPLSINQKNPSQIEFDTSFSIISWNLGYCGLGKEMDFFYDGGKKVRANKELTTTYLNKNLAFVKSLSSVDFWFFQEIDQHSKRSYFVNQSQKLSELLINYNSVFMKNYSVKWVPVPVFNPLGKIEAGMMTFAKYAPIEASRYAYPNIASWPNNLFLLDRGFILARFLLPNKKHLVLMNTHNSYYVNNDSLRKIELNIIREKMLEEYNDGNYVIAGGDWNRLPANFNNVFTGDLQLLQKSIPSFEKIFLPIDWKWSFDTVIYSNRELNTSYHTYTSKKSSIDYFIISPNVELVENYVFPLNFENSDHDPVYMKFRLKNVIPQKKDQQ